MVDCIQTACPVPLRRSSRIGTVQGVLQDRSQLCEHRHTVALQHVPACQLNHWNS